MEVFGAVAAGCALGGELLRLSRALRKMIRSVKYARREIVNLSDEIDMFAALYQSLKTTYDRKRNNGASICTSFPMRKLTSWTESVKRSFEALVDKVEALSYDPEYASMIQTAAAHVKWYFERNTVTCLRASLSVARESITGFLNVVEIESLDEQLKLLRKALHDGNRRAVEQQLGMTIEEAIENTELARYVIAAKPPHCFVYISFSTHTNIARNNCHEQRRNTARRLQRHKDTVIKHQDNRDQQDPLVPDIDRLLSYTERVEHCISNIPVTHSQRPLHRGSPETSSSSTGSASHAASSAESTTAGRFVYQRWTQTGPRGDRAVPLQSQTTPLRPATQFRRDNVQAASPPLVLRRGNTVWINGYRVEMNEGISVERFMREVANDPEKLAECAERLRDLHAGRTDRAQVSTWGIIM
jgi:hypothetical protein